MPTTDVDLLGGIYTAILNSISIPYIISANILIYLIVKFVDSMNKDSIVPSITKKLITLIVVLFGGFVFSKIGTTSMETLITSGLIVPFSYKFVIKYLLKTFGVYYRHIPEKTETEEQQVADDLMNKDDNTKL
jgi:hypothetical protein